MRFLTTIGVVVLFLASTLYGQAIPYTNYIADLRSQLPATDATVGLGSYSDIPWVWHSGPDDPPAPFWNANSMIVEETMFTAPPALDPETFIATIPYAGTLTLNAYEQSSPKDVVGTMVWSLTGTATVDLSVSRAIVDEDRGLIMFKGAGSLLPEGQPVATYTFVEETGVFLDDGIVPVPDPNVSDATSDSKQIHCGRLFVPLLPGVDVADPAQVQQNILTAPMIGGFGEGVWIGHFTFTGPLQPGDADQDFDFDQFDLIRVQQAAKYLTEQPATWGEGDWNGAPGGSAGAPPTGDGFFNQDDIVAALSAGKYMQGPFAALAGQGEGDGKATVTCAVGSPLGGGDSAAVDFRCVPEPSTTVLIGCGLVGLLAMPRRHRAKLPQG